MVTEGSQSVFPPFLEDYGSLSDHLQMRLDDQDKGLLFEGLTQKLVPHTEVGERFDFPQPTPTSHDGGIDFTCEGKDNQSRLFIQAKFLIRDVQTINTILSEFMKHEKIASPPTESRQTNFFPSVDDQAEIKSHFMIVTSGHLKKSLLPKYEKQKPPATFPFYSKLKAEGRINLVDGPDILAVLQKTYRKEHLLPANLALQFIMPPLQNGDVYIGIVEAQRLKGLYDQFGNALFLENIREYLGPSNGHTHPNEEKTVNEKIIETLQQEPQKFLARNNGITFRARVITRLNETTLRLDEASIVNGVQTTMSVVTFPAKESHILLKVVQTENAWDIAEAANFQNEIKRIYLSIARYISPQRIKAIASKSHVKFKSTSEQASVFSILDTIYEHEIAQDEVSSLFVGLFSTTPNNVINTNYAELRTDIIDQIYENDKGGDKTIPILLKLHQITQDSAQRSQKNLNEDLVELFQRFWNRKKPSYRSFLAILAACGCEQKNLYQRKERPAYQDIASFLLDLEQTIDNSPERFTQYYHNAFKLVALDAMRPNEDREQTLKNMSANIERAKFDNLYYKLNLISS